ncbi:MAG: FecR family protein [Thermodesulfobacteriota bacterium]
MRKTLIILNLLILMSCATSVFSQEDESVGIVTALNGQATVTGAEGTEAVEEGTRVYLGDKIETGDDSGVKILFNDDSLISLGANAAFEITEFVYTPAKRKSLSNLIKGKLKGVIQRIPGVESDIEFSTPNAVAGIKGTELYIDASGIFYTYEGQTYVRGILRCPREVVVGAGQFSEILQDGCPSVPAPIPPELQNELIEGTEVEEEAPEDDDSRKAEYPGKELPGKETTPAYSQLISAPLVQPANLLPGVNPQNKAPVDVIVNP